MHDFPLQRHRQCATRATFFLLGTTMAAWAPLVPFAKARVGLDERSLGALLLCLGVGSMLTMPLTGPLAARYGCRVVVAWAAVGTAVVLPLLAVVSSVISLGAALLAFGACVGTVDVAINLQSATVEHDSGRPMMSGFHAMFSIGGIAGAGGVTGLLWLGLSPLVCTLLISVIVLGLLARFEPHLLSDRAAPGAPLLARPSAAVLWLGVLCFITFLAEGSVLDWSAVLLTTLRGVEPSRGGLGYAAFAVAMTLGRFGGDRIVGRLGGPRVLLFGGLVTAAGFSLAVAWPWWIATLAAFALVGLGASNIVPVLTTTAARQAAMPPGLAIATITTIGYTGILAGPASIGFIAHATSLPVAMLSVAALMLVVAASYRAARGHSVSVDAGAVMLI